MTSKQKLQLVAAQYAARALTMTRHADALVEVAAEIGEERAKGLCETLERAGMIDKEGLLLERDTTMDLEVIEGFEDAN